MMSDGKGLLACVVSLFGEVFAGGLAWPRCSAHAPFTSPPVPAILPRCPSRVCRARRGSQCPARCFLPPEVSLPPSDRVSDSPRGVWARAQDQGPSRLPRRRPASSLITRVTTTAAGIRTRDFVWI